MEEKQQIKYGYDEIFMALSKMPDDESNSKTVLIS